MKILVKLIYKLFKTQLNLLIASEQCRPKGFVNMEQIFIDSKGKKYYKFKTFNEMPLERIGRFNTFLMWLNMGLGTFTIQGKKQVLEIDLILSEIKSVLENGLKQGNAVTRISSMISEIEDRKNMVIHSELLYNLLAVQWIREDEHIDTYDANIQIEKINQFKEEVAKSNSYFFFVKANLKEVLPYLEMKKEEWMLLWAESEARIKALQQYLSTKLEGQELENLMKKENYI
jgi:hypothetical protein